MDSKGNIVLTWLCYSSPFTKWSEELLVWGGPRITEGLWQVSAAGQAALHWGHMMQQIPQCLKDHWQTAKLCEPFAGPHIESQHGTLGCGSKTLHHLQIIILPLRDNFWPATGLQIKCLTTGYQVTMRPELPNTNWVLYDPLSPKVGRAQQHVTVKWKQCAPDWAQQAVKAQVKYMKKQPRCSWAHSCYAASVPPTPQHLHLCSQSPGRKRRFGSGWQTVLLDIQGK